MCISQVLGPRAAKNVPHVAISPPTLPQAVPGSANAFFGHKSRKHANADLGVFIAPYTKICFVLCYTPRSEYKHTPWFQRAPFRGSRCLCFVARWNPLTRIAAQPPRASPAGPQDQNLTAAGTVYGRKACQHTRFKPSTVLLQPSFTFRKANLRHVCTTNRKTCS